MDGDEFKFQDPNSEEEEEVEETLSLCDLPLYGDDASASDKYEINNGHNRFSKDEQSWPSMDQQRDQFEFSFSSEEFLSSRNFGDSVIFCGKLITCKEPLAIAKKQHEIPSNKKKENNKKATNNNHHKKKRRRFFRWRLRIFTRSRTQSNKLKVEAKRKSHTDELDKVTAMKCRAKCRWYFFMFGSARFPLEMELHDIKTRQDRRGPSPFMFRSSNVDGKHDEKPRNWGFWRLLKTLSCLGHYSNANALVKSSYASSPKE